jgi:hypothetical protein
MVAVAILSAVVGMVILLGVGGVAFLLGIAFGIKSQES